MKLINHEEKPYFSGTTFAIGQDKIAFNHNQITMLDTNVSNFQILLIVGYG